MAITQILSSAGTSKMTPAQLKKYKEKLKKKEKKKEALLRKQQEQREYNEMMRNRQIANGRNNLTNLTMKLFGLPYQFPDMVDPRVNGISESIGKKYIENIMLEAPICTIIPGEPSYLPGKSKTKKISTAQALIEAQGGNFAALAQGLKDSKDEDLRLYDFKNNYTEYMKYVNILCRTGAVFLDIDDTVTINGFKASFQHFDWKTYKWNMNAYVPVSTKIGVMTKTVKTKIKNATKKDKKSKDKKNKPTYKTTTKTVTQKLSGHKFSMETDDLDDGSLDQLMTNYNYVQFYIDADVSPQENLSNQTGESQFKSAFDSGSSQMKEIAFMANSGGVDTATLKEFTKESAAQLQSGVNTILSGSTIGGALSRLINLGGAVLQGNNVIMPDIYESSSYQKSYSITVHLKSPYGTKLGYYLDIFVPMMHLLALAMPRQASANSFSSPFLVKAYVDGVFSCNLGIVDTISINKVAESWSVSGLPSEVDVTLNITDLYSDLTMSPSSSPIQFANNSSLIEYLATNCGMTLTAPNFKKKWGVIINNLTNSFTDIPDTIKSTVEEKIYSTISSMTSLYR